MNKLTLLRKNNVMVNELRKDRPLLLENILHSIDEYAEYYHKSKVENLGLFSVSGSLRPVLLLASYCSDDNQNCTDTKPCDECLKMCNIAFIEDKAIDINKVVCGFDFIEDYR